MTTEELKQLGINLYQVNGTVGAYTEGSQWGTPGQISLRDASGYGQYDLSTIPEASTLSIPRSSFQYDNLDALISKGQSYLKEYTNYNTEAAYGQALNDWYAANKNSTTPVYSSDGKYVVRDGNLHTIENYNQIFGDANVEGSTAWHDAQVAAGKEIKVPIGSGFGYIPTGSAGEANLSNIGTNNTYQDPNQAGAWTPPQVTNGMNQYYKDAQGNVFKLDGTPVSQDDFQKAGLNIAHINTKQALDSRTGGQQEADTSYSQGGMTTGRTPGEQTDFMKSMTDRLSKIDSLVADIVASVTPSAEEKGVSESLNKMTESFELGMVDIEDQTIPMKAIIGQQAQLERRAGVKIKALQNKLKLLGEDREAKGKALEVAYNASRQGVSDAIKLYEMTQPDRIAFDSKTGTVFFQNPMTGEVYQEKIPGFVPSSDPTALEEEYNLMKKSGYTGSLLDYVQFKATQFGTEKSGTDGDQQKLVTDFNKALSGWDYSTNANREQLIRQLQAAYGWSPANPNGINLDDISRKVYEVYPDNFQDLK